MAVERVKIWPGEKGYLDMNAPYGKSTTNCNFHVKEGSANWYCTRKIGHLPSGLHVFHDSTGLMVRIYRMEVVEKKPTVCKMCHGTGMFQLFTSIEPCVCQSSRDSNSQAKK